MSRRESPEGTREVQITGDLDRPAAEALQLEVRRLLRQHGLEVAGIRIERITEEEIDASPA
jgi:hypothetical protein